MTVLRADGLEARPSVAGGGQERRRRVRTSYTDDLRPAATTGPATTVAFLAYPDAAAEEGELFVRWLDFLRGSLIKKLDGLSEEQARWHPEGKLLSVLGVVNHLTHVEWRWIDGAFVGQETGRSEEEFRPAATVPVSDIVTAYRARGADTAKVVRGAASLSLPCAHPRANGRDLRWVLVHLVEETARHAGHADATRELLDGATGI